MCLWMRRQRRRRRRLQWQGLTAFVYCAIVSGHNRRVYLSGSLAWLLVPCLSYLPVALSHKPRRDQLKYSGSRILETD